MARDALIAIGVALIAVGLYELLGLLGEVLVTTAPETKAPNRWPFVGDCGVVCAGCRQGNVLPAAFCAPDYCQNAFGIVLTTR